jgi:prepilin-type N-terminal cleavage/methylation domain-containing protein
MYKGLSRKRRFGFTLVEVLVTTVVVGVMAAVVVPAVVKHTTGGDSARVASDLGSVKSGIEVFSQSVRPRISGDIEDLINAIGTSDKGADGAVYSQDNVNNWKGPYLEWTVAATTTDANTVEALKSGGNAIISSALYRCPQIAAYGTQGTASDDLPCTIYTGAADGNVAAAYTSVRITGIALGGNEFANLNAIIDGAGEASSTDFGLLRQNAAGTVFFLATPYTAP